MANCSGDVEEKPAESKGKALVEELLPRLVSEVEEDLPRLEVQLSNMELPDEIWTATSSGFSAWPCGALYYVDAWIGPLGPLRVFSTPPLCLSRWFRSSLCCRFDLPISRAVKGAVLYVELVRADPLPTDPGPSSRLRVVGRARVKLGAPVGRHARRGFVLPLHSPSPSAAFVGSVRVDMELFI